MSDGTLLNAGTGGDTINTEDVAGIKTQIIGLMWGIAGSLVRVSGTNPLPVQQYMIAGNAIAVGNGVAGTGVQRMSIASDCSWQPVLGAGTAAIGKLTANSSGVLIGQVEIAASQTIILAAGSAAIGKLAANSSGVLIGQVELAASQTLANVTTVGTITNTVPAKLVPQTSGGNSVSSAVSAASQNPTVVKASAGQVYGIFITNNGTSPRYFKLYNQTGSPTSSDTPVWRGMVPAGGGIAPRFIHGLAMGTGIAYRVTGGIADNDATNIAANECLINVEYT